ncbi:MAG: hypothetical protein JJE39_02410 [Vicinamibacteria bacterium]|nr:hypothetical protein [Vicinamibacteria bacterium]
MGCGAVLSNGFHAPVILASNSSRSGSTDAWSNAADAKGEKMERRTVLLTLSHLAFAAAFALMPPAVALADYGVPSYVVRPPADEGLRIFQKEIFDCRPDHPIGCPFPELVKAMGETWRFPRPVKVTVEQCGIVNAFYNPEDHGVHICYEYVNVVAKRFLEAGKTPSQVLLLTRNYIYFVLAHELGHYSLGELDLGVTAREEDAVDQFATLLAIASGSPEIALSAAAFYSEAKPEAGLPAALQKAIQAGHYADEHSLEPQRFFNIMCTVYGSNPEKFSILVPIQLPEERAVRCPREFTSYQKAWARTMAPFEISGAQRSSAPAPQAGAPGRAGDFAGNWAGRATERTPQGVLTYDVNALIDQTGNTTFGARTKIPTPQGPIEVLLNGQGVESSVVTIQGKPTLRLAVQQIAFTVLATGERYVDIGNTYYLQRSANGLVGQDETGDVGIDLAQQGAPATGQNPPTVQSKLDFSGNWVGKATEKSPQGVVSFEVNAVLQSSGSTFGGRTKINGPTGPLDVLINGDGVETTVTTINGKPTLRLAVRQLIMTMLATGERQPQPGNTYYLQLVAGRLVGQDESGTVTVELERRGANR